MISSIPAIPDAHACSGAPSEKNPESRRQGVRLERRKNGGRFPVPRANHQRFVAGEVAKAAKWQQVARAAEAHVTHSRKQENKKAGARPAFSGRSALAEIVIAACYQYPYLPIVGPKR
jgi:hypothetical protein